MGVIKAEGHSGAGAELGYDLIMRHALGDLSATESNSSASAVEIPNIDQVTHDVANLLTMIAGRTTWLRRHEPRSDQDESLRIIDQAADDAMQLLRRLQPQQSAMVRLRHTVGARHDLRLLTQAALDLVRSRWLAQQHHVEMDVDLGPRDLWIEGSGVELREAMVNVLSNAVDAMPSGGMLRVRSFTVSGDVVLSISDNGEGMSEETVARAFEPYFTTKGDRGTGLGLALCQKILEKHGGSMTLQSQRGAGTTVTFYLPRKG